jgi:cytochrome c peroxidase
VPADNPLSAEKIELGRLLFMDKRLSVDGSRSCYSCHQNELGSTDGRPKALGAGGKPLPRNTPTIWNVGYRTALYWDGRAASLEAQATGAWSGGNMGVGMDNLPAKAKEVGALEEYRPRFAQVFSLAEGEDVKPEQIVQALSAYERTLICGDTAFDRGELSESAARGRDLFSGKAGCVACHSGPEFSDGAYHAIGIGFDESGVAIGEPDLGRGKITNNEAEQHQFRTPPLRNVFRTQPYFHDGSVSKLEEAVRFMAAGGNAKAPNRDPLLADRGLSDAEIADVVSFLESLTCTGALEVTGEQAVPGIPMPVGAGE